VAFSVLGPPGLVKGGRFALRIRRIYRIPDFMHAWNIVVKGNEYIPFSAHPGRDGRGGTMDAVALEALKYPVGKHETVARFDRVAVNAGIAEIAAFPAKLRARLAGVHEADLEKRYRPGGWTVRQLVYHLADSHTHIYVRFKWTLTEDAPTIKAYQEDRWAELPDYRGPVELALRGVESIHERWVALMRTMGDDDFRKAFLHPETGSHMALFDRVANYAWHGRHHLAHVDSALSG
jgi:hypothetical protein